MARQIIFIDSAVQDREQLAALRPAGAEVVLLDAGSDGFSQMQRHLGGRAGVDEIHLVSHGKAGAIQAGSAWLTPSTLATQAASLRAIGDALGGTGDFLIYGCGVAAGDAGHSLLAGVAALTRANVAASATPTGCSELGGDWELEEHVGPVRARPAFTAQAGWPHTLPAAPSAPDLDFISDTGSSSTDNITSSMLPTFTGTAENGATVKLYDTDGTTLLGTDVATGGNWSITLAIPLSSGAHTLTATATDTFGTSTASAELALTIDMTAPTVAITRSGSTTLGTGQTTLVTFTFSEAPDASFTWDGSVGSLTVTGGLLSAISGSGTTRTATFTPTAGASGTASITVNAAQYSDAAGNPGAASAAFSIPYNTLAPVAPGAPDLIAASDSGTSSTDNLTSVTSPTFTGTAEAGSTVTLYDSDGTTVLGTAVAAGGTWSITSSSLTPGAHSLTVKATNSGGTSAASSALAITIDTAGPTGDIATWAFSADTGASAKDFVTRTAAQTISGTTNAAMTTGDIVQVSVDNGTTWATASTFVGGKNWSLAAVLTGSNTLKVRMADSAGAAGVAVSQAYVLDTAAPVLASALVSGTTLVLSYTDAAALDAVHGPTTGRFLVRVDGAIVGVTAVAVDAVAKNITLTLLKAVAQGQAVTVSYADPTSGDDTGAIQDVAGNDAASLSETAATYGTVATVEPPGLTLTGTVGADTLTGQGGRDTFVAGAGRDTLDGAGGIDTAVFDGARAQYAVTHEANGSFSVRLLSDADSVTTLRNVERLTFSDQKLALDPGPMAGPIAGFYQAALGRRPDGAGLEYYAAKLGQTLGMQDMALGFLQSPEFKALYGGLDDTAFITRMYLNALGREPESGGLAFYRDMLERLPDSVDRALMVVGFSQSPEMQAKFTGVADTGMLLV